MKFIMIDKLPNNNSKSCHNINFKIFLEKLNKMIQQEPTGVNPLSIEIGKIINTFSQIKSQAKKQNSMFDQINQNNKEIIKASDGLNQKISQIIEESKYEDESNRYFYIDENSDDDTNTDIHGKFSIDEKIVEINGKIYNIGTEYMCTGSTYITEHMQRISRMKSKYSFVQGFEYCNNILIRQRDKEGSVIILSNHSTKQYFYFVLKNINDLSYDEIHRVVGTDDLGREMKIIDENDDKENYYPQDKQYCKSLLEDQMNIPKNNGCVRIISRKDESYVSWYYLKSNYINNNSNVDSTETISIFEGRWQCNSNLTSLNKKNSNDKYPQGIDYCKSVIKKQMQIGEPVFVITTNEGDHNSLLYFTLKQFLEVASDSEVLLKHANQLNAELNKLDENKDSEIEIYPQGLENCKTLIQEQLKTGGRVHVVHRKRNNSYWFYFKV